MGDLCRVRVGVYEDGRIHACLTAADGHLVIGRCRRRRLGIEVTYPNPDFAAEFYPDRALLVVGVVEKFYGETAEAGDEGKE
ncbi:MAG: hypothetical protein LC795_15465 [Acidobacteria bacterium]|nr:hypothetical protein [Acidobacteriota bacterium]MCA1620674.1 hypothetical protein [Acidobacteriota bacterium]